MNSSVRISTKSTTNFEASGSTELRSHHNVRDQWLLIQGTNKDASRCTGSVASDTGNLSPDQMRKKGSCEKLTRHAFHVINVTLFGSRATSSANSSSSGSSRVSIPRLARFIQTLDRVSIASENHDERTVPKAPVLHQSLLSHHLTAVLKNDTNVLSFHIR